MNPIDKALAGVTLGPPATYRNLQVFPLLRTEDSAPRYITLDEALQLEGFAITEVSEQGSVPDLKATNRLDRPVLLLDGEELVGAKQNRVLNLTVLVGANSEVAIPVSCVEAGRWQHTSARFASAARAQYAEGRAERVRQVSASLRRAEGPRSDQAEVWANIARKQQRLGVESPTRAMADMYDRLRSNIEEYVAALRPLEGQCGAVFVLDGKVKGMDITGDSATFGRLFPKLVRSHALDAIDSAGPAAAGGTAAPDSFLEALKTAGTAEFAAVGLGTDLRFEGEGVHGAGLLWEGELVHLSAFAAP